MGSSVSRANNELGFRGTAYFPSFQTLCGNRLVLVTEAVGERLERRCAAGLRLSSSGLDEASFQARQKLNLRVRVVLSPLPDFFSGGVTTTSSSIRPSHSTSSIRVSLPFTVGTVGLQA